MNPTDQKQDPIKQMASVVSHEIRNPLAIISNSVYYIKTKLSAGGAALDPKLAKHIGIIEGEVKRSNEIIEEMLLYTRPKELNRAPAALNSIATGLEASYELPANITLKTVTDPADPCADMDAEAVTKAARHLLDNAVQAMPEGGAVTVEVSHDAKTASLTVTDTGPGFPGGDGEKAFEPFFTTKPRGLGLGLTIARKFMELHGGTAKAGNAPRGAKAALCLPRIQ
jgi:signal transduction histidine kinase